MQSVNKVVLAYSGGLDTSVIVPWLKENYGCEVITFTADLGQEDELDGLEAKAKASGATKAYIEDIRAEFLTEYAFPTMMAGAIYERQYLLGTSFARPVTAKKLVEIAEKEGADAVAHGCTGKGNDQVTASRKSIYSRDRNIWHMSHEGGPLEDPWQPPPEDIYMITAAPEQAPDEPAYLTLDFAKGFPVALDGTRLGPVELLTRLNALGSAHGVGRLDMVENRLVGMKSRGIYETPGGTILYTAHQALETLCLDRDTMHYKHLVADRFAELVYFGKWFTPLREALWAFVVKTQETVTGTVKVKLYKGHCTHVGCRSLYSLYNEAFATFGQDEVYNQGDAAGFINLFGLPLKVRALMEMGQSGNQQIDK
jgi:argininosuccinate synthase